MLLSEDGSHGRLAFPLHDESNTDISRLLLKIGIEILSPLLYALGTPSSAYDLSEAKRYLITGVGSHWPYFVLLNAEATPHLVSVFADCGEDHEYIRSCGFDIFLHEVDGGPVLFFAYGNCFFAISLSSRDTAWRQVLVEWGVAHVGCPVEYANLCG